ncbi:MAG: DUF2309 domain-containing protein [Planctomycetaceae bacterium]
MPRAADSTDKLAETLRKVGNTIAPVWPLQDYVAVNPYLGLADRPFLNARRFLRVFSDCETLMPLDYYRTEFQRGHFTKSDISAALNELHEAGFDGAGELCTDDVTALLGGESGSEKTKIDARCVNALSEIVDRYSGSDWTGIIRDEVGRFCAAHYDNGQAAWRSPWKNLPLFQAWRSAATVDRQVEILGLKGFRGFVSALPHTPVPAIEVLLKKLMVPERLWEAFLLCQAFTVPGWAAWTRYQARKTENQGEGIADLAGLVAMRLAYDVAVAELEDFAVDWTSIADYRSELLTVPVSESEPDALPRFVLLRASEIAYRNRFLDGIEAAVREDAKKRSTSHPSSKRNTLALAQMVFCIDVRSEAFRRSIESVSDRVETYGFAGFFGLPIQYVPVDATSGSNQVPALISPSITVHEGVDSADGRATAKLAGRRTLRRMLAAAWKAFQSSAVSCFGFVETSGLLYGAKLIRRSLPDVVRSNPDSDQRPGPVLCGLHQQGLTTSRQADLAESMLRGIGLTDRYARLVVFCGHASQTENNPLQAGLDCGACGGHSGEPNARLAAKLLNQKSVRRKLAERGLEIPEETHFAAAVHNTASDQLTFFDLQLLPATHRDDLRELTEFAEVATSLSRAERMARLAADTPDVVLRRTTDWSEVRPEWGLAGNAAFVAAPRSVTRSVNLGGRCFLHSYDIRQDPEFAVLEQIMTAPLIVAHWINMQYYASTVDNRHFGSGDKTIHNVVGRIGIHSGNGGDLMTGLPFQSLHDGTDFQHEPLRLLVIIAAPRQAIASIIRRHDVLRNLVANDWLHVVSIDEGSFFRFAAGYSGREWAELKAHPREVH